MNILIIDNCESLRYFCKHVLLKEGHTINEADYSSYREQIENNIYEYDTIILNINPMEEELINTLYNEIMDLAPQAQILLLSINWCTKTLIKLISRGCIHLTIPFNTNDLLSIIENIQVKYH